MEIITSRAQLTALADDLGVRLDWHEPDEQGLTAITAGRQFDNAGFWPTASQPEYVEKHVIIRKDGQDVAAVNLASLLAWASYGDRAE